MNTNKGSIVKQSGNDVEGCRSEKVLVLVQPNMRTRISAIQCNEILILIGIFEVSLIVSKWTFRSCSQTCNSLRLTLMIEQV